QFDVSLAQLPTGGGSFVALGVRNVGATRYNAQLHVAADGRVGLSLVSVVDWSETWLGGFTLPESYTPGTVLTVRVEVSGTGPTTLKAKAWAAGGTEPGWQIETTDDTAALQR